MQTTMFDGIGESLGDVEVWCRDQGHEVIVGVDEAGRGPLAGPVYAAAVALDCRALEADWIDLLDDSKQLEVAGREAAFEQIPRHACASAIASEGPESIDEHNILEATRRAMTRSVEQVCGRLDGAASCVFVDGDVSLDVDETVRTLVGGDGRSYAIAAASILAKVSRDGVMEKFHEQWPAYNFASNKGYPTADHRRTLRERGPCPIHRRSFSGVDDE